MPLPEAHSQRIHALYGGRSTLLLDRFPGLKGRLPWLPLAELSGRRPTPVEELPSPNPAGGVRLFMKRDDLTSPDYGGNKVRKLEHIIADALMRERKTLITAGALGSNHALATATHGVRRGFQVDLCLFDQPITEHVLTNLLANARLGARVIYRRKSVPALWAARRTYVERKKQGDAPYFVMVGGTTPLGNTGYLNAGLELAAQIDAGELPVPERIFLPAGTCGTVAGLIAGLRIAGLPTRCVAVRVLDAYITNTARVRALAQSTVDMLHRLDPRVPRVRITSDDVELEPGYFDGYGVVTQAGTEAIAWMAPYVKLETTYSGKALAACLDYCRNAGSGETVLFWNTFNSAPVTPAPDPSGLPEELHHLFGEAGGRGFTTEAQSTRRGHGDSAAV